MTRHAWKNAVPLELKAGRTLAVACVEEALTQLIDWRGPESYKTRSAVASCLDAVMGECSAEEVRSAFLTACRERKCLDAESKADDGATPPRERRSQPIPGRRRPLPWRKRKTPAARS